MFMRLIENFCIHKNIPCQFLFLFIYFKHKIKLSLPKIEKSLQRNHGIEFEPTTATYPYSSSSNDLLKNVTML